MHTVPKVTFRLITFSVQIPFFGNKSSIDALCVLKNTPFHFINCFKLQLSLPRILLVHPILFFHANPFARNILQQFILSCNAPRGAQKHLYFFLKIALMQLS